MSFGPDRSHGARPVIASGWAEVLTMLPLHFGFHLHDSVVLIGLEPLDHTGGSRWQLGPMLRADLDQLDTSADLAHLFSRLGEWGVRHLAIIVIAELSGYHRWDEGAGSGELARAARAVDLDLVEATVTVGGRWRPLGGADPWLPVPTLDAVPGAADLVIDGHAALAHRDELMALPHARPDLWTTLSRSISEFCTQGSDPADPPQAARIAAAWNRLLSPTSDATVDLTSRDDGDLGDDLGGNSGGDLTRDPNDQDLAAVAVALRTVDYRDALLARLIPGWADQPGLVALTHRYRAALPQPGRPARGRVVDLLPAIARLPDEDRAPFATVVGVLAWARGLGPVATAAIGAARASDPEYRLAILAEQLLVHLVCPPA